MKFKYRTLAVAVAAALVAPTQATFAQDENLTEEVVVIGGNNITDENGQKATDVNNLGLNTATILGNTYSQYSPFGISGAFWYARYRYSF